MIDQDWVYGGSGTDLHMLRIRSADIVALNRRPNRADPASIRALSHARSFLRHTYRLNDAGRLLSGRTSLDGDFANVTTKLVIIGLPSSGKSTVFNALSRSTAETGSFGGDDEPNLATVKVPDERLDTLTELFQPQRRVPADVQYLDVRGIDKGISEQGMSGQLLGHLSQGDALVHVVRAFADEATPHPEGSVDPARDIETMNLELTFSDLAVVDKRLAARDSAASQNEGRRARSLRARAKAHGATQGDTRSRDAAA